jgi:hypothetical protein
LHPDVLNAYHAVAIDERRAEFPAKLWTSPGRTPEQIWFCGVHCDVGGNYPGDSASSALSDPKFTLDTKQESWNVGRLFPERRTIAANSTIATVYLPGVQTIPPAAPGNSRSPTDNSRPHMAEPRRPVGLFRGPADNHVNFKSKLSRAIEALSNENDSLYLSLQIGCGRGRNGGSQT